MTTLAATIGTGNIVGVATALAAGGSGALVWMEISAAIGMASKFAECTLAVKYREKDIHGRWHGGPMYVMERAIRPRVLGHTMAVVFSVSTVLASFGIGCMTQSNSIAAALGGAFHLSALPVGILTALLALPVLLGGIRSIAGISSIVVPCIGVLFLAANLAVILGNLPQLPAALETMFRSAFAPRAAAGGAAGALTASWLESARWGVSRGVFSNEAGMGSAAISAACAETDHPARQGYIHMTGTFFDTILLCTLTGLAICSSGALESGADGIALTVLAFSSVLGPTAGIVLCIAMVLFAFSTILGWAYQGEVAAEFLLGPAVRLPFRMLFALAAFWGAVLPLDSVFAFSDICNAMMCLPNLVSLLLLSGTVRREIFSFQAQIRQEMRQK